LLGLFLIIYAILSWSGKIKIKTSDTTTLVGGSVSGFFAGLIGTGGALRGAFLTSFQLTKEKYIATSAAIALAVDATRLPIYLKEGYLDRSLYWFIPVIFFTAIAGSFAGKKIVDKIPQAFFKKCVLVAIFSIGIKFVVDWL